MEWLLLAAFTHNNHTHSATGKSPFEVNYSYNAHVLPGAKAQTLFWTPALTTFVSKMQEIHAAAKQSLKKAADQMKAQYDKKKCPAIDYQVEDKVGLNTTNLHLPQPKKKLTDKWMGPFMITTKKGASAYTLKLLTNWHIHPTFNRALLTLYTPPTFPNQEQPPPPLPDLINGTEHYEVKKVLDSRRRKVKGKAREPWCRVTNYFVKWKGYGPESNSWVLEDNMDMDKLIEEFLAEHVNWIANRTPDWQFYIDPFMGERVWYDQEEAWDRFGCPDPEQETRGPFKMMGIP